MDELIVFLMHYFGWRLEYTTDLVNTLPLGKLQALVKEAYFQKAEDDYRTSWNFAMALANWATAQGKKKFRPTDFIGRPPQRENEDKPDLADAARRKGIILPKGGI